jgi:hypothetical protein
LAPRAARQGLHDTAVPAPTAMSTAQTAATAKRSAPSSCSTDGAPNAMRDSKLSTTNDSRRYHSSVWWRARCPGRMKILTRDPAPSRPPDELGQQH